MIQEPIRQLLVVEDEPKVATFIKKGLQTQAYLVDVALTGADGKALFDSKPFDLVIMDVNLPDMSGLEADGIHTRAE